MMTIPVTANLSAFDMVIPLFRVRWNTRAVLEGLTYHYAPRCIHIITPAAEARSLRFQVQGWQVAPSLIYEEEAFFEPIYLSKETLCAELDLGTSLYTPGWFYQQLLKLGAYEGISDLTEWYVVWDSDLLPVATWPLLEVSDAGQSRHLFALLQHNQYGNSKIVETWAKWIRTVLAIAPVTDPVGTFIPHHMWFCKTHLRTLAERIKAYYGSSDSWLRLMMRSAMEFGTFSEYWIYSSWVAATAPEDLAFHPYATYGETTERFFDDGTGLFSRALREALSIPASEMDFAPSYGEIDQFIRSVYSGDRLPSSLAFESSPRHLKKNEETLHIEEQRSRWNPRNYSHAT